MGADLEYHGNAPVTLPPSEQAALDVPYVKKLCKTCDAEICVKDITLKCRRCNHCSNCFKDLKKGGGRHRLCPVCMTRCFDHRDGRLCCQKCQPTRSVTNRKRRKLNNLVP